MMRTLSPLHPMTIATIAVLAAAPIAVEAQRQPQQARPATGGPWQCEPADPQRAVSRTIRADSLRRLNVTTPPAGTAPITGGTARSREFPEYDVVLEIPNLCVNRLFLRVDSLSAKINLDARVANLVRVSAGADVFIDNVDLTIQGVRAQALLLIDLDDVYFIVDRTLTFVDNHPEVVRQLGSTLQTTVGGVTGLVGAVVRGLVLSSTTNTAGQMLQRVVDQATGNIVEQTLSRAGEAVSQRVVGSVLNLQAVGESRNQAGQTIRRVRDTVTGRLIELTLDAAGRLLASRLL